MNTAKRYADLIVRCGMNRQTEHQTVQHLVFPRFMGGHRLKENTVWLSPRHALTARALLFHATPTKTARVKAARWILRLFDSGAMDEFEGKAAWLRRAAMRRLPRPPEPSSHTLFHVDGRRATGSRVELVRKTGLHSDRVRDLVTGRRPYCSGWCASLEEAKKGPRRRGRPKQAHLLEAAFRELLNA